MSAKNNKICFSKSVGIIFFAVVIIGIFTFLTFQLTEQPTSTNTRASTPKKSTQPSNTLPIIGGELAGDGEFPFYVVLLDTSGFAFCGGALVGEDWVLTAGHCISGVKTLFGNDPLDIEVIVGLDHLDKELMALHYSGVDNVILHENYNDSDNNLVKKYDIALLHLKNKTDRIPTLSLFNPKGGKYLEEMGAAMNISADSMVTSIGFGATTNSGFSPVIFSNYGNLSTDLKKLSLTIQKRGLFDYHERFSLYSSGQTAPGDSGSPALFRYKDRIYLLGINSSASVVSPEIFTSVSHFFPWIYEKTRIDANSGTYTIDDQKLEKKPIPVCTQITTIDKCDKKGYLCSWDSSINKCVNNPRGR